MNSTGEWNTTRSVFGPAFSKPFAPEHIVSVKDSLIVHIHVGERVEPLENQIDVFVRNHRRIGIKSGPIFPIREANPLQARVVILVKRIGDEIVVQ
jgi:hypothetical protein